MAYRGRRIAAQEYTDLETGEILHYGNLVATPLPKPGIGDDFMMVKQSSLLRLAKDENLTLEDWRVLSAYIGYADWENVVRTSQKEIAEHLGMKPSNVSRSTKKLIEKKILIEIQKVGRHKHYQFNEFYGWKGDSENYQKKLKQDAKLKQKTI